MEHLKNLTQTIVTSIVDDEKGVSISMSETEKGTLIEVRVSKEDVGKVIGKQGRIATSIRTVATVATGIPLNKTV